MELHLWNSWKHGRELTRIVPTAPENHKPKEVFEAARCEIFPEDFQRNSLPSFCLLKELEEPMEPLPHEPRGTTDPHPSKCSQQDF